MSKKFILLLVCVVLAGCSLYNIDSQDTTLDFYPPKASPDKVVYLENVDQPHEIIGIVTVDTERNRSLDEVIAKMKYEAAILGGDAITDVRRDSAEGADAGRAKLLSNAYIRIRYTAKVVAFK